MTQLKIIKSFSSNALAMKFCQGARINICQNEAKQIVHKTRNHEEPGGGSYGCCVYGGSCIVSGDGNQVE